MGRRMLSAKLDATKLPVVKARPESLLGVGLIATRLARTLSSCGTIEFHAFVFTLLRVLPHLALSLLEGEGINPEHADPLFGKIHLPLHLNSSVSFQISRLSASSFPSPFQGEGRG